MTDRLAAAEMLLVRTETLLQIYHEAYVAHHPNGPDGCPCCAEFRPRVETASRAMERALTLWQRSIEETS